MRVRRASKLRRQGREAFRKRRDPSITKELAGTEHAGGEEGQKIEEGRA
jgi:hypothetical protein